MTGPPARALTGGERAFSRLGRGIVRHPWYPILFWVLLLLVTLPFLGRLGSVQANSASSVPSSSPSAQTSAEIARLFPGSSGGSSSLVVVTGPAVTGPPGQAFVDGLTSTLAANTSLTYLGSVDSVYTAYGQYLGGVGTLAVATIDAGLATSPSLPNATAAAATAVWSPPSAFVATWAGLVAAHPGTSPSSWNLPAYNTTAATLGADPTALAVLDGFYGGAGGGFNGSGCATAPNVTACADGAARAGIGPLLPGLASNASALEVATAALANLGTENATVAASQRFASSVVLAEESGLPTRFLYLVWTTFPSGSAPPGAVDAWAQGIATTTPVSSYPLPVPTAIWSQFVDPAADATLVVVSFTQDSGYTTSSGAEPIHDDVTTVQSIVGAVAARDDPAHAFGVVQTGPAALDAEESQDLAASLAIVLPLTILALVVITIAYFRGPLVPLVTFGGLGIALVLGLGGVVLLGTLITRVDPTALTLENTFVLGVGTDYAIFLVARYREELRKGVPSDEAIVTTVTWAGQSIATSGATAILATLALAFSGVALLSQWGMVLSFAVLMAVLVSLTVIPALLRLLGPRVFWPVTGARAARDAAASEAEVAAERTYFYRTGRRVAKRPGIVVVLVLLASIPLLYVALTATSSFDFYQQLPAGHSASDGLALVGDRFGAGYTFPMSVLVTFRAPLLANGTPDAGEFVSLANVTGLLTNSSGVAAVDSPVGTYGAPLAAWTGYATALPAVQAELSGTLGTYLGIDGRTVLLTVVPTASGLSADAVALLGRLEATMNGYAATHADVSAIAFGGGAPTTSDIQASTALATQRMAILVSIGLVVVLFVVLRSFLIPLLAVATIGLSIGWAWGITNLLLGDLLGIPLFYFVPTVLFILILGLGIDYNIFLLTRVREERLAGRASVEATVQAVGRTGGIITAAAVILASAFAILIAGDFLLLKAIGFAVATAIVLDAVVVRTYLVPAALVLLKDRVWAEVRLGRRPPAAPSGPEP